MMKLGYNARRIINSFELPYLTLDPPLIFEINNATSFQWNLGMQNWALEDGEEPSDKATIELAAGLLLSVETMDGEKYELGTIETIQEFVDSSSMQTLRDIMKAWIMLRAIENTAAQKK